MDNNPTPPPAANIAQTALNRASRTGQMLSPWLQRQASDSRPAPLVLRQRPATLTAPNTSLLLNRLEHVTQPVTWQPDVGSLKPGMTDSFAAAVEQRFQFKPIGAKQIVRQDEAEAEPADAAMPPLAGPFTAPSTEPAQPADDPRQILRRAQAVHAARTGTPIPPAPPPPAEPEPAAAIQHAPDSPLARLLAQFPDTKGGQLIPPAPKSTKSKKPAKPIISPRARIFSRVQEGAAGNLPEPTTPPPAEPATAKKSGAPIKIKPTPSAARAADREAAAPQPAAEEGDSEAEVSHPHIPVDRPTTEQPVSPPDSEMPLAVPPPASASPAPAAAPPAGTRPIQPKADLADAPSGAKPAARLPLAAAAPPQPQPPATGRPPQPAPTAASDTPAPAADLPGRSSEPPEPPSPRLPLPPVEPAPPAGLPLAPVVPAQPPTPPETPAEGIRQRPEQPAPPKSPAEARAVAPAGGDAPEPPAALPPARPETAPAEEIAFSAEPVEPPRPRLSPEPAPPPEEAFLPEMPLPRPAQPAEQPPAPAEPAPTPAIAPAAAEPPAGELARTEPAEPRPRITPNPPAPPADAPLPEMPMPRPAQPAEVSRQAETAPAADIPPTSTPTPPATPPQAAASAPTGAAEAPRPRISPDPPAADLLLPRQPEEEMPVAASPAVTPPPAKEAAGPTEATPPGIAPPQLPAVAGLAPDSETTPKRSLVFLDRDVLARTGVEADFPPAQPPPSRPALFRRPVKPTAPARLVARHAREQLAARGWRFKTNPGETSGGAARQVIQTATALDSSPSQGRPLADTPRVQMESLLQRDFSGVRIHRADLGPLNVQAATRGSDVYVDRSVDDSFSQPDSMALLGHELTHVSQQTGPAPAPAARSVARMPAEVGAQEAEATRTEQSVYRFARTGEMPLKSSAVQRAPEDELDSTASGSTLLGSISSLDLAQNNGAASSPTSPEAEPDDSANTEMLDDLRNIFEEMLDEKVSEMLEAMGIEPEGNSEQPAETGPRLDDLARDVLPFVKRLIAVERERRS
ncbi:MAG: hypothetical protein Kow0031_31810 [Anaerolineae bacterium]